MGLWYDMLDEGGQELWPSRWQRAQEGAHIEWAYVWDQLKVVESLLPVKVWLNWWRIIHRNILLRDRTGCWAAEGRGCEWCEHTSWGAEIVQTVSHLTWCSGLYRWWKEWNRLIYAKRSQLKDDNALDREYWWQLPSAGLFNNLTKAVVW